MKVGVYVDGYNLYYGGRSLCGKDVTGWKWLNIRQLIEPYAAWGGAALDRIVYCTARVNDPDQDSFLNALIHFGAVDEIIEGHYVSWAREKPLVEGDPRTKAPNLFRMDVDEVLPPALPLRITPDESVLALVRIREEKGSDVNVASHLLRDTYTNQIDAAIVVSNDSDLGRPLNFARAEIPVGTINPQKAYLAGALRGVASEGAGRHWWKQLQPRDFIENQLPDQVGVWRKPSDW